MMGNVVSASRTPQCDSPTRVPRETLIPDEQCARGRGRVERARRGGRARGKGPARWVELTEPELGGRRPRSEQPKGRGGAGEATRWDPGRTHQRAAASPEGAPECRPPSFRSSLSRALAVSPPGRGRARRASGARGGAGGGGQCATGWCCCARVRSRPRCTSGCGCAPRRPPAPPGTAWQVRAGRRGWAWGWGWDGFLGVAQAVCVCLGVLGCPPGRGNGLHSTKQMALLILIFFFFLHFQGVRSKQT